MVSPAFRPAPLRGTRRPEPAGLLVQHPLGRAHNGAAEQAAAAGAGGPVWGFGLRNVLTPVGPAQQTRRLWRARPHIGRMSKVTDEKKRSVEPPKATFRRPPVAISEVLLADDEDVVWKWTHTPQGSYVSGYDIVKKDLSTGQAGDSTA